MKIPWGQKITITDKGCDYDGLKVKESTKFKTKLTEINGIKFVKNTVKKLNKQNKQTKNLIIIK